MISSNQSQDNGSRWLNNGEPTNNGRVGACLPPKLRNSSDHSCRYTIDACWDHCHCRWATIHFWCLMNHLVMTQVPAICYFVDTELPYPPQFALCEAVTSTSHIVGSCFHTIHDGRDAPHTDCEKSGTPHLDQNLFFLRYLQLFLGWLINLDSYVFINSTAYSKRDVRDPW